MKFKQSTVKRYNLATSKVPDDFGIFGKVFVVPQYNLTYPPPTKQEIRKSLLLAKKRIHGASGR